MRRLALVLGLLLPLAASAQRQATRVVIPEAQQAKMVVYNVLLGAGIGGLGAVLNGDEGAWHARFARGAAGGAFGGAVWYGSKRMTQLMDSEGSLAYALPASILHEAGGSIVENAALDDPLFGRFSAHTGFVRWEWEPGAKVRAKVLPFEAAAFGIMAARHKLDVGRSLLFTTPVFTGPERVPYPLAGGRLTDGFAFLGEMYLVDDAENQLAAHELVHVFQVREMHRTMALHTPLARPLAETGWGEAVGNYVHVDSPHVIAFVYLVIEGGNQSALCYFNNWLEREAETLSSGEDVRICRYD